MDTKEKTVWVESKGGIRNQQAGNTREVPAHGEYSGGESFILKNNNKEKKMKTENKLHNCKNMLGCQTSSEKWQLNSVLAEEFEPS